jgi:antitoxin VapB
MTRTTLFRTNNAQAIRLPEDVAFPPGVHEVTIIRDGARRILVPANAQWDDFFAAPGIDLGERVQPALAGRPDTT